MNFPNQDFREDNTAGSNSAQTGLGMFKNRLNLFGSNTRKPLKKLADGGSAFNVFKQRFHGNTGFAENPGATKFSRNPLHRIAL